jgi:hypothetical protein
MVCGDVASMKADMQVLLRKEIGPTKRAAEMRF